MKNINKLTFCAIIAALSVCFMLVSFFPYLTYAIPALSGLFFMVVLIEIDVKWAVASYFTATAVLLITPADIESKALFICFFGFYPILKAVIEKLNKVVFEWLIKFTIFNVAIVIVYLVFSKIAGISLNEFMLFGKYSLLIFAGLGNVVFFVYDIAVSRMAMFYMATMHNKIKKLLG